jgi:hypothetical protein
LVAHVPQTETGLNKLLESNRSEINVIAVHRQPGSARVLGGNDLRARSLKEKPRPPSHQDDNSNDAWNQKPWPMRSWLRLLA